MKLEQIIKLKLNNFEIKYPEKAAIEPNPCWEGYEPIGLKDDGSPNCVPIKEEMQTVSVDLANYPWEQCIADQIERYGDEETAKKVCGAIKAMYGSKEAFVIPSPESGEDEQKYISRCISDISAEYDQEGQAYAVCKGKWDGK
jgi:hypothetical protein